MNLTSSNLWVTLDLPTISTGNYHLTFCQMILGGRCRRADFDMIWLMYMFQCSPGQRIFLLSGRRYHKAALTWEDALYSDARFVQFFCLFSAGGAAFYMFVVLDSDSAIFFFHSHRSTIPCLLQTKKTVWALSKVYLMWISRLRNMKIMYLPIKLWFLWLQ